MWLGSTRLCRCVRTAAAVLVIKPQSHLGVFESDWTGLHSTRLCWCVRTLAVAAESTHSSDSLKHGFRSHRMFTAGHAKKLHYQWDLHRLVVCKADVTCYCRWFDSGPGQIEFTHIKLAANLCGAESCSWTGAYVRSAVGGSSAGACGYEAFRLFNTYRFSERGYCLWNFSNDKQSVIFWTLESLWTSLWGLKISHQEGSNVGHNNDEQMQRFHEKTHQ